MEIADLQDLEVLARTILPSNRVQTMPILSAIFSLPVSYKEDTRKVSSTNMR